MKKQSNPPPPDGIPPPPPPNPPPTVEGSKIKTWIDRFISNIGRDMTKSEHDSMMAMAGRKRCRHCKEWL